MAPKFQRLKRPDGIPSKLDVALQFLTGAKDACGVAPAQIALGSACVLLTMIRDIMGNKQDRLVDLGLFCARVCEVLDRGLDGKRSNDLNKSVHKAIEQLTATMAEIRGNIIERGKRHWISGILNARGDRNAIAAWREELVMVLDVFNTELILNTYVAVERVSQKLDAFGYANQRGARCLSPSSLASIPLGESPPLPPKAFFGRNDLIEDIVGRAEKFESIALIGAGGIGKTSIALTVLHDPRIKHRFGDNRRFIRCDKFSASRANFLARLSRAVGSGIKNPEDLTPLRPFLSSKTMILCLDNAESILDPRGTDAREIYALVEELSCFSNICLSITSRISTVPPQCKRLEIPTLPMEAACNIFYSVYGDVERSRVVNDLLQRLDFHTLSIKLLATAACHSMWDHDRLAREWGTHRAQILRTDYDESLAATIELSLASPTFQDLGPNARELLGVIAFFPQGIDENNLDWLFPTIPNRRDVFDKFCILSLTSRSNGFITMLAPIRDYLRPQHPTSSLLLCATRDRYFTRLSVDVHPNKPGFEGAEWIVMEDVNVEHLLDVFTSIGANSDSIWDVCFHFMEHLFWHKPRQTVLGPRIEGLSDDHRSKSKCLFELARLFDQVGNWTEEIRLLTYTLQLGRREEDDRRVAETLRLLCDANRMLGRFEEGIQQAREAIGICERLCDTIGQAHGWNFLAFALFGDGRLDEAEDAASRAISLMPENGQDPLVCESHEVLGRVYDRKGEIEKAIHHLETGLKIASAFNRHDHLFWIHLALVRVFRDQKRFNDANTHLEKVKSRAGDNLYYLGRTMETQATIWYRQRRLEDAKSEILRALEIYENLGAATDVGSCRGILRDIEGAQGSYSIGVQSASDTTRHRKNTASSSR